MKITVEEYAKIMEMKGRTNALKDFIKSQGDYSSTISKTDCMAILGLNSEEEEKNETAKEADTQA